MCKGFLLVALLAFLIAGCVPFAAQLPSGSVPSIPPGHVVAFGRIEAKWADRESRYRISAGSLHIVDKRLAEPFRTKNGYLRLSKLSKKGSLAIRVTGNDDFFSVIPAEDFLFVDLENGEITRCKDLGFTVPKDASAVYLGTLDFQFRRVSILRLPSVTLSVRDDYDQAVQRLRERNPDIQGETAKALFHHEPLSDDPACKVEGKGGGFIAPISPAAFQFRGF